MISIFLRRLCIAAALLAGAAFLVPAETQAGSCCGGGSAASLMLPKFAKTMIDTSFDYEKYDGFWTKDGTYQKDQPGTDLSQYRLNIGIAQRLTKRWQTSFSVPYVWNRNKYSGLSSQSDGPGDSTISVWYEAFDTEMCRLKAATLADLVPAATFGVTLLIPTGISPYDDVNSSFDITGRGFYRLDGNVLLDKTLYPWNASLLMSYGTYIERPVNREYGKFVQPYRKRLGDRASGSLALGYQHIIDSLEARPIMTLTASLAELWEGEGTINGERDPSTGLRKTSVGGTISLSTLDRRWVGKASWNHALGANGWGSNFPVSDIYTVGVSRAFE